jgi:hypothetical protein
MADLPEHEIVTLLAEPLDRFVEARTARVKELKAAGQKEVAVELAKVRKPSRLVWAVGELGRRHPDEVAGVVQLAADLEVATSGGGGDVRSLLNRFREAIAGLTQRPDGTLGIDGPQLGLALRSVLGDTYARQAWADGRLLDLPAEGAFGGPSDLAALSPSRPKPTPPAPKSVAKGRTGRRGPAASAEDQAREEQREQEEADRRAREAEEEARRLRDAVDRAAGEVEAACTDRSAASDDVDDLESRIADLTRELEGARARLRATEEAEREATERLDQARRALDDVEG